MDQFVLVPASLYNKSLNTHPVTKQELPNYQSLHNPTYQIDSLSRKKFFDRADFLVDEFLSCPRIKLSNSQALLLDGVETEVLL